MAFADADFTAQVARMLEDDFTQTRPMKLAELNAQSFWHRFAVQAARLTAPVQ